MKSINFKNPVFINIAVIFILVLGGIAFVLYPQIKSTKINENKSSDLQSLDGQIESYKKAIKANPNYIKPYLDLSQAYLQQVPITADVSYYEEILDLMNRAEKIDPKNSDIFAIRSSVEIGRHHFKQGEDLVLKAITLNPNNHLYYGLLGDSQIELGKYNEAILSFQKMADLRPDYSSYIRIAYVRELYGDIKGAKDFLELAISSGSSSTNNIAFAYTELGKLNMREDLIKSVQDFNNALKISPDYPPALEGLGKVSFFQKDTAKAEEYFLKAYEKLPIVQYATDLGDLYFKEGDTTKSKQYYKLAEISFDKSTSSGVDTDLEYSLFLSDHDLNIEQSISKAEKAYRERPYIYSADYLSWALYKNGEYAKAATYSKEAFRIGEIDPVILFHQGLIALKNNDKPLAKKYLLKSQKNNLNFSILHKDILEEALKTLN